MIKLFLDKENKNQPMKKGISMKTEIELLKKFLSVNSSILSNKSDFFIEKKRRENIFLSPHFETELLFDLMKSQNSEISIFSHILFFKILKIYEYKEKIKEIVLKKLEEEDLDLFFKLNSYFSLFLISEASEIYDEIKEKNHSIKVKVWNILLKKQRNEPLSFYKQELEELQKFILSKNQKRALDFFFEDLKVKTEEKFDFLDFPFIFDFEMISKKASSKIFIKLEKIMDEFDFYDNKMKIKALKMHLHTDFSKKESQKMKEILEENKREDFGIKELKEIYALNLMHKNILLSQICEIQFEQKQDINLLKESIKHHPTKENVEKMALILFQQQKTDECLNFIKKQQRKNISTKILNLNACILLKKNEFEKAEKIFQFLCFKNSEDHKIFFNLALCFLRQEKLEKALFYFKKSYLIFPSENTKEIIEKISSKNHQSSS